MTCDARAHLLPPKVTWLISHRLRWIRYHRGTPGHALRNARCRGCHLTWPPPQWRIWWPQGRPSVAQASPPSASLRLPLGAAGQVLRPLHRGASQRQSRRANASVHHAAVHLTHQVRSHRTGLPEPRILAAVLNYDCAATFRAQSTCDYEMVSYLVELGAKLLRADMRCSCVAAPPEAAAAAQAVSGAREVTAPAKQKPVSRSGVGGVRGLPEAGTCDGWGAVPTSAGLKKRAGPALGSRAGAKQARAAHDENVPAGGVVHSLRQRWTRHSAPLRVRKIGSVTNCGTRLGGSGHPQRAPKAGDVGGFIRSTAPA